MGIWSRQALLGFRWFVGAAWCPRCVPSGWDKANLETKILTWVHCRLPQTTVTRTTIHVWTVCSQNICACARIVLLYRAKILRPSILFDEAWTSTTLPPTRGFTALQPFSNSRDARSQAQGQNKLSFVKVKVQQAAVNRLMAQNVLDVILLEQKLGNTSRLPVPIGKRYFKQSAVDEGGTPDYADGSRLPTKKRWWAPLR